MKKILSLFLVALTLSALFTSCRKEGNYVENTCPYALMVQDTMYYYTDEEIDEKIKIRDEDILGHVTSVIPESSMPSVNDQANIDILGAPYMMYDGNLIVLIDGEWIIFEVREKGKNEISEETDDSGILTEPPTLEIICGENSIYALRGGYSWIIKHGEFETATITDSVHPLETKEIIPHISIVPTIYSHIDPLLVRFGWSTAPDSVSVRAWSETCFGKPESIGEEIEVSTVQLDYVGSKPNYTIRLKDGNYIYEVEAKWDREGYSGSVNYCFFAEKSGLHVCDDTCSYPLKEHSQEK